MGVFIALSLVCHRSLFLRKFLAAPKSKTGRIVRCYSLLKSIQPGYGQWLGFLVRKKGPLGAGRVGLSPAL
ncbi:MAG: hypothetical protein EB078_03890 [Proteobacteria bacterium]|nr:hypothetical protein [Pseudomonadota bacterium]